MSAFKPREDTVVIFQSDDLGPIESLRRDVEEAAVQPDGPRRLNQKSAVKLAAELYDEFIAQAAERGEKVVLRALGRKQWRDILHEHPVRKVEVPDDEGKPVEVDHEGDARWGFNQDTIGDDLVPACVVDRERYDDEFLDSLADGDWSRLVSAAILLNQGSGPDPKARISSRIGPMSDDSSE